MVATPIWRRVQHRSLTRTGALSREREAVALPLQQLQTGHMTFVGRNYAFIRRRAVAPTEHDRGNDRVFISTEAGRGDGISLCSAGQRLSARAT
jgi:hypothetical protein